MNQILVKIAKNYQPALFALFIVLGLQTLGVMGQATAPKSAPASAAEAKRGLAAIDARSFAKIKDARMRKAMEQSYKALKAVADNPSEARETRLLADFDQSIKNLKALPQPANGAGFQECDGSYDRCMELCKEGGNCKLCALNNNMCYMNKLAIEVTKNPLDPDNN